MNTSSGDVFEFGVPSYQLTAGVGQTESWGGEQAGQPENWGGEQAGCYGRRVQDPPCDPCQEEESVRDGTWWKEVVGAEWRGQWWCIGHCLSLCECFEGVGVVYRPLFIVV